MKIEVKHRPGPAGNSSKILRDSKPLKQQWQSPSFSQQLPVSTRMLQLIESDYSQSKRQIVEIIHTSSQKETRTEDYFGHPLSARTIPTNQKMVKEESRKKQTTSQLARLKAYYFGNFELQVDRKRIDKWQSLKAKSLLKILVACKNKPINKDVLIEILWPNCGPEEGKNNLKAVIYFLRQTLLGHQADSRVSQLILFSEGQYLINPEAELWVDVNEFEYHWLNGRNLEKKGKKEEAIREFCLAEELYRGDYLEEDRYAEWTLLQREALKDTYLAILNKLANSSFDVADYESCIIYSQKILLKDVCHEEAYRWLMRCYSRLGNSRRARQWYEVCAKALKKELDTVPDDKTADLYRRLLSKESI
jgi:DNA-binding SARP family transcriptional activator